MDHSSLEAKIRLYQSLFSGREDIYAVHWTKGDKSGYMPAKLYDPYFNRTHKKAASSVNPEPISYFKKNPAIIWFAGFYTFW